MQTTDIKNPSERKKLIWAGVLGMLALVLLWWALIGFGKSGSKVASTTPGPKPSAGNRSPSSKIDPKTAIELKGDLLDQLRPINVAYSTPNAPEAKRNIFVYYEPRKPVEKPAIIPTPTPTPTPPVLLVGLSPANVFARTGDFTLEISGDKFNPLLKVFIDSNEMPTRYISPQQLSATIPAAVIANSGGREVILRSSDGAFYSNSTTLSVAAPPVPNYAYVGIFGTRRHIDIAILQDKASKEMVNVQRGDLLGGRFRVTSISEKELVVIDNNLKIKHTLALTNQGDKGNPLQRPTPRVEGEDDEL